MPLAGLIKGSRARAKQTDRILKQVCNSLVLLNKICGAEYMLGVVKQNKPGRRVQTHFTWSKHSKNVCLPQHGNFMQTLPRIVELSKLNKRQLGDDETTFGDLGEKDQDSLLTVCDLAPPVPCKLTPMHAKHLAHSSRDNLRVLIIGLDPLRNACKGFHEKLLMKMTSLHHKLPPRSGGLSKFDA